MNVLNDHILVELDKDDYGFETQDGIAFSGIAVKMPDKLNYFGFHSFAFERSLEADLKELYNYYKKLIGKRVYWTSLAERGGVFKKKDKVYAIIKLTDLMFWDEPHIEITKVEHSSNKGLGL